MASPEPPASLATEFDMRVLFAASEAQPLIKTGGLADVAGSLPKALGKLGCDVRLILPAYPEALAKCDSLDQIASFPLPGYAEPVRLLEAVSREVSVPLYLVDAPRYFDRPGNPYLGPAGFDWPDNPDRFALFCRAIAAIALDKIDLGWRPRLVHGNDWQTGLVAPLLIDAPQRPATLFTIHNLAYQGLFDRWTFARLDLPMSLWSMQGLEFHQHLSFIKAGIAFSDLVTTVSPTYAEEIRTPAFGYGLEGLLQSLGDRLVGLLNGVDYDLWDPATDPALVRHFDRFTFNQRKLNKLALQQEFDLPEDEQALLFGHIGRLVEQKGVDLILDVLPGILDRGGTQMLVLGSGDSELVRRLRTAADRYAGRLAIMIGYDERLAHRIEAGCDCFLMPSRFEPCGLNQMYSQRYGAVPIVRRTGGLADTVIEANEENLSRERATGFLFDQASAHDLWLAVERAINLWKQRPDTWQQLAINGMAQDFSWQARAKQYLDLYRRAMGAPITNPITAAPSGAQGESSDFVTGFR